MDENMSMKFNNVIPFPKKKIDVTYAELHDMVLQKQKELEELDVKMADILDQEIEIEKNHNGLWI